MNTNVAGFGVDAIRKPVEPVIKLTIKGWRFYQKRSDGHLNRFLC